MYMHTYRHVPCPEGPRYIHTHIHTYVHTHIHIHIHTNVNIGQRYTHKHKHTYTYIHVRKHAYIPTKIFQRGRLSANLHAVPQMTCDQVSLCGVLGLCRSLNGYEHQLYQSAQTCLCVRCCALGWNFPPDSSSLAHV